MTWVRRPPSCSSATWAADASGSTADLTRCMTGVVSGRTAESRTASRYASGENVLRNRSIRSSADSPTTPVPGPPPDDAPRDMAPRDLTPGDAARPGSTGPPASGATNVSECADSSSRAASGATSGGPADAARRAATPLAPGARSTGTSTVSTWRGVPGRVWRATHGASAAGASRNTGSATWCSALGSRSPVSGSATPSRCAGLSGATAVSSRGWASRPLPLHSRRGSACSTATGPHRCCARRARRVRGSRQAGYTPSVRMRTTAPGPSAMDGARRPRSPTRAGSNRCCRTGSKGAAASQHRAHLGGDRVPHPHGGRPVDPEHGR